MKPIFTLLVVIVFLTSCNKKTSDSELFIGTFRSMDELIPFPFIILQKKDSIALFNNKGGIIDIIKKDSVISNDTLKFKNKYFFIRKKQKDYFIAYDLLDTIIFKPFKNGKLNPKGGARFQKIDFKNNLNSEKVKDEMLNTIWRYNVIEDENSNPNKDLNIEQLLRFDNDSLHIITNYFYQGLKTVSEYETKGFSVFKIENNCFLSFQKENDNPQPVFQITNYNSKNIELKDFSSRVIKNINFYKDSVSKEEYEEMIENTSHYSNCFDGYQGEYYFDEDVTFNKGNKYILDFVNIDLPKNDIKSGYIIVHFNINCNGNVGRFGLIQMNREFKKTSFSKEMVNHILNKVSQLKDFPSTHSKSEWLDYKDVHAFLMFKLKNGKIIEVCP